MQLNKGSIPTTLGWAWSLFIRWNCKLFVSTQHSPPCHPNTYTIFITSLWITTVISLKSNQYSPCPLFVPKDKYLVKQTKPIHSHSAAKNTIRNSTWKDPYWPWGKCLFFEIFWTVSLSSWSSIKPSPV